MVVMRFYIEDRNQRLAFVRTIADTDRILLGKRRNILFFDPSNKLFGKADTLNGVRLID